MAYPVTADAAYLFAPDRRSNGWTRLIGPFARLLAAALSRRHGVRRVS
jgi:hypothetical protein